MNEFKTSISALAKPSTFTSGKSGVQTALDSVKTSLDNLKSELKSDDKPKVDAPKSAIADLQKTVDPSGLSEISEVASAAKAVGQSAQVVVGGENRLSVELVAPPVKRICLPCRDA